MSGTSLDGIDLALTRTDGVAVVELGPGRTFPYSPSARSQLMAATELAREIPTATLADRSVWPEQLRQAETLVTELNAEHILSVVAECGERPRLVGFHGQTVVHRPDERLTVQLGNGLELAQAVGIPVVSNFRVADMVAGGQGAPLAPFFHHALSATLGFGHPWAALNLGGVANVTLVDPTLPDPTSPGAVLAFDTGPGCGMVDSWMELHTGQGVDRDGECAARGTVDQEVLNSYLSHPYFTMAPPKSLDRGTFRPLAADSLSLEDGAATLTAFTGAAVGLAAKSFPVQPSEWLVVGGGRHNVELMRLLTMEVPGRVQLAEAMGINGDMVEAYAFAYLAERSVRSLPITAPGITGCTFPVTGGELAAPQ